MGSCGGCARRSVQFKLTVGPADDAYERAADRAADQVVNAPGADRITLGALSLTQIQPLTQIQRRCFGCAQDRHHEVVEEAGGQLQRRARGTEGQRNVAAAGWVASPRAQSQVDALRGGGDPLPAGERAFFESRFGQDFSQVRIHSGGRAAAAAQAVDALAFTSERDVVFGAGQYQPGTVGGRWLIAHELAHVVQQGQAPGLLQRLTITQHTFTKGDCGARNVQWVFSLDSAAPADGYIVQNLTLSEFIKTCPDLAIGPPATSLNFWEAWRVKKGDKVDWTTVRDKWTDGSKRPGAPNTNGINSAAGTVKFFTQAVTGDLGDFSVAPTDPKSAWGPGKVPISQAVPSTATKPSWWDTTPTEGPADRRATSQWNCCGTDKTKHTSNVTATP